jgi:hypothetical protein
MEKTCTRCGQTKPLTEFYRSSAGKDGYAHGCKTCHSEYQRNKLRENNELNLHGTTYDDYHNCFELLKFMGYDIGGDIHKQFADKHGLKYRKRPYKNVLPPYGKEALKKLQGEN